MIEGVWGRGKTAAASSKANSTRVYNKWKATSWNNYSTSIRWIRRDGNKIDLIMTTFNCNLQKFVDKGKSAS